MYLSTSTSRHEVCERLAPEYHVHKAFLVGLPCPSHCTDGVCHSGQLKKPASTKDNIACPRLNLCRREEVERSWKDTPRLSTKVSKLSPEVHDLLDKMLNTQPEKRFAVEDIKQHTWYQRTLPQKYQAVLDRLQEQQHGLEEHVSRQKHDEVSTLLLLSSHLAGPESEWKCMQ